MPVMRGDEAIPLIRRLNPSVGIVVYSGSDDRHVGTDADAQILKGTNLRELVAALREILGQRSYDIVRLDLGSTPLPQVTDAFDAMAGILTRLLEIADAGGEAISNLLNTTGAEVRALLGIYAHLGYSLRRSARAGNPNLMLVVHSFRTQAAMARRALEAIGSPETVALLCKGNPSSADIEPLIETINSKLLAALPKNIPAATA